MVERAPRRGDAGVDGASGTFRCGPHGGAQRGEDRSGPAAARRMRPWYSRSIIRSRWNAGASGLKQQGAPPGIALATDWDRISPEFTAVRGAGYVLWYPVALEPAVLAQGNSVFSAVAGVARARGGLLVSGAGARGRDDHRARRKVITPLGATVPVLTSVGSADGDAQWRRGVCRCAAGRRGIVRERGDGSFRERVAAAAQAGGAGMGAAGGGRRAV